MRFTDHFRRRIIAEIQHRARIVWDPTEPRFHSCGARSDAFHGVEYRLHDASIQQDIRRMWLRWVKAVYDYKLKRLSRKPKFYAELHFIHSLYMDLISILAHVYKVCVFFPDFLMCVLKVCMEKLLQRAAFETERDGSKQVTPEHLRRVAPYVFLRF